MTVVPVAALAAAAGDGGFDFGQLVSQGLVSLLTPTILLAPFLIRWWRRKLAAEASKDEATADETDAKAEVLLSGEALELFRTARQDSVEARTEAKEARAEAAKCRRSNAALWVKVDVYDRHLAAVEAAVVRLGGDVPPRPSLIAHPD